MKLSFHTCDLEFYMLGHALEELAAIGPLESSFYLATSQVVKRRVGWKW